MSPSRRRFVRGCLLSLIAITALVVPSVADAGMLGEQCSGSNITAKGSGLQRIAQQSVWDPNFNKSANALACSGTQGSKGVPTVKYEGVGSGVGMEAWGINGHAFEGSVAFIGTSEPPNAAEREEILSHSKHPSETKLETIPVAEEAVAIVVHLPTGCTATSISHPGRLVLDNVTLEKIFRGVITKWSQITDNGDKLEGASCSPTSTITRVVRRDQAGTSFFLKKYFFLINGEANLEVEIEGKKEKKTWKQISEGKINTVWPGVVTRETGDSEVAALVASTPSSISYASLANVRSHGSFSPSSGGANTERFWVPIQNNGIEQEEETYVDPSSNGDSTTTANSNCVGTQRTNGEIPFPPASTTELWNEVTPETAETNYTLCSLTYDLTFREYSQYSGTTLEEATTVNNFMQWVIANGVGGGQTELAKHDYLALPTALATIARRGAEATKF